MRARTLFAVGCLSAAAVAACGAFGSDDDAPASTTPPDDAGDASTTITGDAMDDDAGKDASPALAKLTFVNAATDLGPKSSIGAAGAQAMRLCLKLDGAVAPLPPLPRVAPSSVPQGSPPGFYDGTGGVLPSLGIDLAKHAVVPIVMNAATMAAKGFVKPSSGGAEATCDEILDSAKHPDVAQNVDYWVLDDIPAGPFVAEKSFLVALTGCAGDATVADKSTCSAGFAGGAPGRGNLRVSLFEVARAASRANALGVQFAHFAPGYNVRYGTLAPITPGFTADPSNPGAYRAIADAGVPLLSLTMAVTANVADSDSFASHPNGNGTAVLPMQLPIIQALSDLGSGTPSVYASPGKNFVFIAVGDPDKNLPTWVFADGNGADAGEPGANFNLRKYHYLAFPTDPDVQPYTP